MMETSVHDEIFKPPSTVVLEYITAALSGEEGSIISKSGRLNSKGREISEAVYQQSLSAVDHRYKELLNICTESESLLDSENNEYRDVETEKIIRSVRAKAVYEAHRLFAENALLTDRLGDESASNVMRYARILAEGNGIDVYEEATRIEKERGRIDELLRNETASLAGGNLQIIKGDIAQVSVRTAGLDAEGQKLIVRGISDKAGDFTGKSFGLSVRRKMVSAGLTLVALTGLVVGAAACTKKEGKIDAETLAQAKNHPRPAYSVTEQPFTQSDDAPVDVAVPDIYDEFYLQSESEIPIGTALPIVQEEQIELLKVGSDTEEETTALKNTESKKEPMRVVLDTRVPEEFRGFADPPTRGSDGSFRWKQQGWLPLPPEILPDYDLLNPSPETYMKLINFFNVPDLKNQRYAPTSENTYCNIFVSDVTMAMGVPIPRYIDGEETYANFIYDWLKNPDTGGFLQWKEVTAEEAQASANHGFPTVAVAKSEYGSGHLAMVIPGTGEVVNGAFYPTSAQAGKKNFVGRSTYTGFKDWINRTGLNPTYYVNESGGYDFIPPDGENTDVPDYTLITVDIES